MTTPAVPDDLRAFRLEDDALHLLDQRALPVEERWLKLTTVEGVAEAIETLAVRGAPAIGGAAACGMVIAAREHAAMGDGAPLLDRLDEADARLRKTRPTAVNLFFALDRMRAVTGALRKAGAGAEDAHAALEREARAICDEDAEMCRRMGEHGATLFEDGDRVLTVCHTGALATCGIGTALGALKTAQAQGKDIHVFALETRPLLQGARLTAWECQKVGLPVTLITDGMAGFALARQGITRAISGADRIATNGDSANKIGTYSLATLCAAHDVPFYVAAPTSTIDRACASGDGIPIEERAADEIRAPRGAIFAPADVDVWNPAFDVTPHDRIAAIVTEEGVFNAPYDFRATR
jgi:methylthioribose-1-phosphate isomerase